MKNKLLSLLAIGFTFIMYAQENEIESTGNVGIGVTNPTEALVVNGTIALDYNGRNDLFGIKRNGITTEYFNRVTLGEDNVIHQFDGNGKTIMSLTQGGKVTVNGAIALDYNGRSDLFGIKRNGITTEYFNSVTLAENNIIHQFIGNNTTIMSLTQGGNVGIGTINPDSRLTVAGKIHSQEVKVTATAGGADFVFENNYNLPTLNSVELFVKENKHLPEIPSAKEMELNGLNLAEMNIKLLQKIEELTLYTIQQEKELKSQKSKIEKIEKKNELLTSLSKKLSKMQLQLEKLESKN